jgi:hypothetical protein
VGATGDNGSYRGNGRIETKSVTGWRAATEALLGGDTILPRIGIMRALYRGEKPQRCAKGGQRTIGSF